METFSSWIDGQRGVFILSLVIGVYLLWWVYKLLYRNRYWNKRAVHMNGFANDLVFLQVRIPQNRAKNADRESTDHIDRMEQNIELMNQLYKNINAIYEGTGVTKRYGEKYVSMEMMVDNDLIKFVLAVPVDHAETIEKTISSFYPGSLVDIIPQPSLLTPGYYMSGGELVLKKDHGFPIKTYETFEADPMDSIFAAASKVKTDEKMLLQVLLSPVDEKRHKKLRKEVSDIKEEKKKKSLKDYVLLFLKKMIAREDKEEQDKESHTFSQQQLSDLDKKVEDELFDVRIHLYASASTKQRADSMVTDMVRAFQQYNYMGLNGFSYNKASNIRRFVKHVIARKFVFPVSWKKRFEQYKRRMILNIRELSSFFHLPHSRFNRTPRIDWQKYKAVPAPQNIPHEGIFLGYNLYGGVKRKIHVSSTDRFRHFYIIGQTGTGKSTMMENMAVQDMRNKNGFCVIDPHGQFCDGILPYLPKDRIDDLIYFDLSNTEYPIAFNPFEAESDEEMDIVTNDMIEMFVGMYGQEIFGPRIQDYFINASFLLMSQPDGGTLPEIMRLFTDDAYLETKLKHLKNPVINSRWRKTYKAMGDREKKEIIPFLQSKFSSFTNGVYVRNVIGQPKSAFNFGQAMQEGKIILCNLSKGLTGELNSQLVGRMFAMQIKIHALRRAAIAEEDRTPFFLYVDEFQNYVSKSFESILSEARKYRLGLCMAHQYIDQLKATGLGGSMDMSKPIFGNVGSKLFLKVGPEDADFLASEVEPEFTKADLINMDRFKGIMTLSVDTQPSRPFSIQPYYIRGEEEIHTPEKLEIIKQISSLKWGTKRELAEKEIFYRVGI